MLRSLLPWHRGEVTRVSDSGSDFRTGVGGPQGCGGNVMDLIPRVIFHPHSSSGLYQRDSCLDDSVSLNKRCSLERLTGSTALYEHWDQ